MRDVLSKYMFDLKEVRWGKGRKGKNFNLILVWFMREVEILKLNYVFTLQVFNFNLTSFSPTFLTCLFHPSSKCLSLFITPLLSLSLIFCLMIMSLFLFSRMSCFSPIVHLHPFNLVWSCYSFFDFVPKWFQNLEFDFAPISKKTVATYYEIFQFKTLRTTNRST